MQHFIKMLKLDKANPDAPPPGATEVIPKPASEQPPATSTPPLEEDGDTHDDLGYAKVPPVTPTPEGTAPKTGDKPAQAAAAKPAEVTNPATGYGKEPPVVPDAPVVPATVVPPPVPDELDKSVEGLPEIDAKEIKTFAKENGLSPEIAKKWADRVKTMIANQKVEATNMEKEREQEKLRTRAQWHKELKDDKDFGGEKFDLSLSRSEKTLSEFFPELKKELTDNKTILRPSVMRGLNRIAEKLHATENLVHGDPVVVQKPDEEKDEALEFYQ